MELTVAIIKPNLIKNKTYKQALKEITQLSIEQDFDIDVLHRGSMPRENAIQFYMEHINQPFFKELIEFMTEGDIIVMVLVGDNVVQKWRNIIGATKPQDRTPECLRAKYGDPTVTMLNGFHGSDSFESAIREYKLIKTWN